MTRSDAVRQSVLARDGYRCQICGYDGRSEQYRPWVVPHHGVQEGKLGMGGSEERDTVDNAITLCSSIERLGLPPDRRPFLGLGGEGSCHGLVENGHIIITNWDAGARTFDVLDIERRAVSHDRLWCYRRRLAEELEPVEARVQGLHMIDGAVARDIWRLWKDDAWKALDPEAKSFNAYAASRGWDVRRANQFARLYQEGIDEGVEWIESVTAAEFKKALKSDRSERTFVHFLFDAGLLEKLIDQGCVKVMRATDDEIALSKGAMVGTRSGKLWGIHSEGGELVLPSGKKLEVSERVATE